MIRPALPAAPSLAAALSVAAVTAIAAVAAVAPASAETLVKGPGNLSINCDDFRLYPNGTIESSKDATLVYPDKKGSFAQISFGPHTTSSSGIDLGEWINTSCKK